MQPDFAKLASPFPRENVSWRCQTLTRDGSKGLALAYIDARDVMHRLDEVCGPASWQDRYEVHGTKTICYLSLLVDGHWVTKADGAGDTDVEAEKGSISDAFKRAAVKWGIGRYLYDIEAPWVPCESRDGRGDKKQWVRWTADPWSCVRQPRPTAQPQKQGLEEFPGPSVQAQGMAKAVRDCQSESDLTSLRNQPEFRSFWSEAGKIDRDFVIRAVDAWKARHCVPENAP